MKADADERHSMSKSHPYPHSLPHLSPQLDISTSVFHFYYIFRSRLRKSRISNYRSDLDHSVPHPLAALHLERATRFGFESSCQVLVARTYNLSWHLSELDSSPNMGIRFRRTLGGGCVYSQPRSQASHAVAYRSKLPFIL